MFKTVGALAIATTLAVATLTVPQTAEAKCVGCAFAGGVVAGALIASAATARPAPYYGAYAGPTCYWQKQKVFDGVFWTWRNVRVCY